MPKYAWSSVGAWALAILLAAMFIGAGWPKLQGLSAMVSRFEAWGYAPWFVPVIGVVEVGGGVMTLVPRLAFFGALLIAADMIGATITHLATGIGSPIFSLAMLGAALGLAWLRADRTGLRSPVTRRRDGSA